MKNRKLTGLIIALFAAGILLAGCQGGVNELRAMLEVLEENQQGITQSMEALEASIASMPEGEDKEKYKDYYSKLSVALEEANLRIAALRAELAGAETDADAYAATAKAAASFLPPPWNGLAALIVSLGFAVYGEYQRRRKSKAEAAFRATAAAIDMTKPSLTEAELAALRTNLKVMQESTGTQVTANELRGK